MKKLSVLALTLCSATAFAAPVGNLFTGVGVGAELASTKYENADRKANGSIIVDYGIDYGNNWVGVVEGKLKPHNSTLVDSDGFTLKEKQRLSASYLQGYRVSDLLPYVKVGYTVAKFKSEENRTLANASYHSSSSATKGGISYGAGVKYAVSQDVEVGLDYTRAHIKFSDGTAKSNSFGANVGYRF